MEYTIGQKLKWIPDSAHEKQAEVEVTELRRGGKAKLSNGWVVDEDGYAEGTLRLPGGTVQDV